MQLYIIIFFIRMKPVCGQHEIAATFLVGVCALVRASVRLFVHPCVQIGIVKGQICLT